MKSFFVITALVFTAVFFTGCCDCDLLRDRSSSSGVILTPPAAPAVEHELETVQKGVTQQNTVPSGE